MKKQLFRAADLMVADIEHELRCHLTHDQLRSEQEKDQAEPDLSSGLNTMS
jgi:hypothetical protein